MKLNMRLWRLWAQMQIIYTLNMLQNAVIDENLALQLDSEEMDAKAKGKKLSNACY